MLVDILDDDFCEANLNPCYNGGTCINLYKKDMASQNLIAGYKCICPALFTGKQCDFLARKKEEKIQPTKLSNSLEWLKFPNFGIRELLGGEKVSTSEPDTKTSEPEDVETETVESTQEIFTSGTVNAN